MKTRAIVFAAACLILNGCSCSNPKWPDTDCNWEGFQRETGMGRRVGVKNVYYYADEFFPSFTCYLSFECRLSLVDSIADQKKMYKLTRRQGWSDYDRTRGLPWWPSDSLLLTCKAYYIDGKGSATRMWFDPKTGKAYLVVVNI